MQKDFVRNLQLLACLLEQCYKKTLFLFQVFGIIQEEQRSRRRPSEIQEARPFARDIGYHSDTH